MDWSTVAAAAAGGLIGVLAEMAGRINARRDADRAHSKSRADAREDHLMALADEDRRTRQERSFRAADQILKAFADNPVHAAAEDSPDVAKAAHHIMMQIYYSTLLIPDGELRHRFDAMSDAIDLAIDSKLPDYTIGETIFISRYNAYRWLGAHLRGDPLIAPDKDWAGIEKSLEKGINNWHEELERRGVNVHPRTYHERR